MVADTAFKDFSVKSSFGRDRGRRSDRRLPVPIPILPHQHRIVHCTSFRSYSVRISLGSVVAGNNILYVRRLLPKPIPGLGIFHRLSSRFSLDYDMDGNIFGHLQLGVGTIYDSVFGNSSDVSRWRPFVQRTCG